MGNTLNVAAQWTSVGEISRGCLEMTVPNEVILDRISKFVSNFSINHSKETAVMFYQPFIWMSGVETYTIVENLAKKNENVYFLDHESDSGKPSLTAKISKSGDVAEIKAYNFKALATVLQWVPGTELAEIKTCLEANPDPMHCILGPRFSETYNILESPITDYLEGALCALDKDESSKIKETYNFLTFAMILKEFDVLLMKEVLLVMGSVIKLTPPEVENHFNAVSTIVSGSKDTPVLKSIAWMSPFTFVFGNGCRAPLWRQLYGDIAYIVATTVNNTNIFITASTAGYYANQREGFLNNDETDFDRSGQLFPNLILLLKSSCNDFKENIDKVLMNSRLTHHSLFAASRGEIKESSGENEVFREASGESILLATSLMVVEEDNQCLKDDDMLSAESVAKREEIREETKSTKYEVPKKTKRKHKYCSDKIAPKNIELEKWLRECSTEESDPGSDSDRDGPPEKTIYNYNVKPRDPKFAGYWHIQNMFQFIKTGGHPPTLIGLCSILDMDLAQENVAMSIVEANGVEVLVNILEVNDFECQLASLKILTEISRYRPIWQCIINLGGIEILIDLLHNTNIPIRCLAAECLGAVAKTSKARQLIRSRNGLYKLVSFLDTFVSKKDYILGKGHKFYPLLPPRQLAKLESGPILNFLEEQWKRNMQLAKSAAVVLAALSNSKRARKLMQLYNILPNLSRLLKSTEVSFLTPVVKIVAEFAKESQYRSSMLSENMVPYLVHDLNYNDTSLMERICTVLIRACEDERIRNEVRKQKGLISLKKILVFNHGSDNPDLPLMKAVTGAISKLCLSPDNVEGFSNLGIIPILIPLMRNESIKVLLHVLASLIEILKVPRNRMEFNKNGGLQSLLSLQSNTIPQVLILVNYALAQCAEEMSLINTIIEKDGVRLLWSLLTHPNDEVKASAAWAIAPCIKTAQDSGYMVRSLVSGLEILAKLLKSSNINVLAGVCATIANVVQDEENLGILTEFEVCCLLSKILCAQHYDGINKLKAALSEAIAQCCKCDGNRVVFGREDVIVHLVKYLDTDDPRIQKATAKALYQLSLVPENIVRMHSEGCIKPLLKLIGSTDESIQEAASKCISNIRNLAFANNKIRYKSFEL